MVVSLINKIAWEREGERGRQWGEEREGGKEEGERKKMYSQKPIRRHTKFKRHIPDASSRGSSFL